jgi:hypothetical protein
MNDIKKYSYDDLSLFVVITLILMILAGCSYAFVNFSQSVLSFGVPYALFELFVTIVTIVANILLLSVNIRGLYLHIAIRILIFIITICIDLEAGIKCFFMSAGVVGFIFLILQIRENGISIWKMMLANEKIKKGNILPESATSLGPPPVDQKEDSELTTPSTSQLSSEIPPISTVAETPADSPVYVPPYPVSQIAETSNSANEEETIIKQSECKATKELEQSREDEKSKKLLRVKLNLFLYIALGIFVSIQILSICIDASFISLGMYYCTPSVEIWRIVLSSINIVLALVFILWKKGWVYVCLTAISIALIFIIDSKALEKQNSIRDILFNLMLFIGAYLPLIITLFLKNQGVSGWQILFGHPSTPYPAFEMSLRSKRDEKNTMIVTEEIDRYTKLYRAISPANFVEPYSPKKVKLANELLEALIKNKDNEVVISLIEEKAKNALGVSL